MGLDFIREKANYYVQRRDRSAIKEFKTEDLLSGYKGNFRVKTFQCMLTEQQAKIEPGLGLLLQAINETDVHILQHGRKIGCVLAEDAIQIIAAMKDNQIVGGIITVSIVEPPAFDGVFTVKPKRDFKIP